VDHDGGAELAGPFRQRDEAAGAPGGRETGLHGEGRR
jgi:hypothetical protein